jgi:outer membrane protein assembly factor BamB
MKRESFAGQSLGLALGLSAIVFCSIVAAADWARFHGPDGSGVSTDRQSLPATWSEKANVKWKIKLPGPGSSSPIVVGQRVVVTCWTGYAADPSSEGDQKDLRRHVVCLDRETGKVLWDAAVEPFLPEDPYSGQFTQHGYTSHTPVSDGKRIYVFFGKTGVLAFDLDGKKLWQTSVGTGSGARGWGTASSPILHKNLVIIPATAESESLVALNQEDGKEVWRYKDRGLSLVWGTPVLVNCGEGRTDLVVAVPGKILGVDPDGGKLRWKSDGLASDSICTSAIAGDGIVYALETGPRGGGNIAVRAGGEGDVSKTNIVWRGKDRSRIVTPVLERGRIYFTNGRAANCLDAATGKSIYRTSLTGGSLPAEPQPGGFPPGGDRPSGQRPGGGRPGGRGPLMGQDYSSPILADGKIISLSRSGDAYVYTAGPEFKLLAQNRFAQGSGDFSASPAVSDGQLFIRSSKYLYCIAEHFKAD